MVEYLDNGDVAVFDGYTFRKDKKTGYFLSAKPIRDGHRCRLHVYVWEKVNGRRVPEGYEVHHADENKMHNEPENLDCITADEHRKYHATHISEERRKKMIKNVIEKAVPAARAWHSSPEGFAWHSQNAKKTMRNRKMRKYICSYCGKEFETKHIYSKTENHFCSNNCKSAFRRELGVDNETRTCEICGKEFVVNKYSKVRFCSKECQGKNMSKINAAKRAAGIPI